MATPHSRTFSASAKGASAHLILNWHSGHPSAVPGTATVPPGSGYLTIRLQLIMPAGNVQNPTLRGWLIPAIPAGGWPLTPHQRDAIEKRLKNELEIRSDPAGAAFGTRLEEAFTGLLTSFTQSNAASRMTSITYQRKRLRERFGDPELIVSNGSAIGHAPFAIVWERPMRGGDAAAARGLVRVKGGKPLLEVLLAEPNSKGIAHTLNAHDVAEALLRIEDTMLGLRVRENLLTGTEVDINPRLPTSGAFWRRAKSGVSYTSVKLLRMDAGCWGLVMARRISGGHRVEPTVITLSLSAGISALVGHMQARGLTMKHHSAWRLVQMMAEWREHTERRNRKTPTITAEETPNGTPIERDPIYERLRNEVIETISQDETLMADLDSMRFNGNLGNLDKT